MCNRSHLPFHFHFHLAFGTAQLILCVAAAAVAVVVTLYQASACTCVSLCSYSTAACYCCATVIISISFTLPLSHASSSFSSVRFGRSVGSVPLVAHEIKRIPLLDLFVRVVQQHPGHNNNNSLSQQLVTVYTAHREHRIPPPKSKSIFSFVSFSLRLLPALSFSVVARARTENTEMRWNNVQHECQLSNSYETDNN